MTALHALVSGSAARTPDAPAVRAPDGALDYAALDAWSNRAARTLRARGVRPGDRVLLWAAKSWRLIALMQGALRIGAAYVPLAADVPAARARAVMTDCDVRLIATDQVRLAQFAEGGATPPALLVDAWDDVAAASSAPVTPHDGAPDDLAYILYTSGSTGGPKGVCISHRNALAFVEWAAREARCHAGSRLANHAALSFDLSVFDLYAAFLVGACVSIVPPEAGAAPARLVDFIAHERITVWYSVPSILVLMSTHGGLLARADLSIETVIFAGEVYPIRHLRRLREAWPQVRLLNFYGPTETNVCTWYEVGAIDPARTTPVPIGQASCGDRVWLADADGRPIDGDGHGGTEGELLVDGPTVMLGYWGAQPQRGRPYRTGDICQREADGMLVYVGRRDALVKLHGHRIELGEVEATLAAHPAVADAAALVTGDGADARLVAFIVTAAAPPPSLLALKAHCARSLPPYMVIALAWPIDALPRTPNGKVDRPRLAELAAAALHAATSPCS